ncbi:TRAP transporter small permease subunit [Pseudophaeobacter flagellatus]|uniref:TRAP transporter small permease subunit n=1 Tax=Pseudophaeobacter flagellatus TaxID=2899119 RepID=UPI001E3AF6DC|nr:TRAP transporter small permease [Pseudophaeobacter flagellatus]MCD9148693.1 TRAP transporter small permease [Pseudophaeobacter flagellatus]
MASKIQTYIRSMDVISETTGAIAAWMFFTTGIIVFFEVFMRYVLNSPTIWVDEMSRIFQVWAAYLAIGYVLKHKAHIIIDVTFRDPHTFNRRLVDSFAMVVIILFCLITVKYGLDIWWKSTKAGHTTDSYLAVPKTFVQSAIWVGFGVMALQALAEIFKIWTWDPDDLPKQTLVH